MNLADLKPRVVRPLDKGAELREHPNLEVVQLPNLEPAMPRGVYERKKKTGAASKKRAPGAAPPVAKKSRGGYSQVLADLREKRQQIDQAIAAIEALA